MSQEVTLLLEPEPGGRPVKLSLADHFLRPEEKLRTFIRKKGGRPRDFARSLRLAKTISLPAREGKVLFFYRILNDSVKPLRLLFGCELNLGLRDAHFNRVGEVLGVRRFAVVDPRVHLQAALSFSRPVHLWYFPLEVPLSRKSPRQRLYQGLCLTFLWPLNLKKRQAWEVRGQLALEDPDGGF